MKIKACRLRILDIPFVIAFKHSSHERSDVQTVLVEVETEGQIIGYGEALPREYVTGESIDSVKGKLTSIVFPKIKGMTFDTPNHLITFLEDFEASFPELSEHDLCVKAAIELALLDAMGKTVDRSLVEMLGGAKSANIQYSGIVSAENPFVVEQFIQKYKKIGITTIKLKVGTNPEQDLKNVQLARELLGPSANIRIDANEAWTLEEAKQQLDAFLPYQVASVEQPLKASDKHDYPQLTAYLNNAMDVSLDESVCSFEEARWMSEHKGASMFNLRVSKNGGLINSLKLARLAAEHGVKCQLGAQVGETSILTSAGLTLAALLGNCVYHEGAFGTRLLEVDITDSPLQFGPKGWLTVDTIKNKPGLGIDVDRTRLEDLTTELCA